MQLSNILNRIFCNSNNNLLSLDLYNWFGFDYEAIRRFVNASGYTYYKYDVNAAFSCKYDDITGKYYKGINIDAAIKYTVCNELELMPGQIDLSNEDHLNVVEKWRAAAKSCVEYTLATIRNNKITKILIPQGYLIEAAVARMVANKLGLSILSIENSLSKDRLLWDNLSGITVNYNLSKNYYWKYYESIDQQTADDFVASYLDNIREYKSSEHSSPTKTLDISKNKKTILFLGQVYVDSSVVFNLYDYMDPVEIIELLCEYCTKNDYNLIVKLHPKEISGNTIVNKPFDKLTWRKLLNSQNYCTKYNDSTSIIIDHDNIYDTYSLITMSDVCVTINSMSGLEACLMQKHVINCGYSCYSGFGFTSEARDKGLLYYFLDKYLDQDNAIINSNDVNVFFYIYLKLFCIDKTEASLAHAVTSK